MKSYKLLMFFWLIYGILELKSKHSEPQKPIYAFHSLFLSLINDVSNQMQKKKKSSQLFL